MKSTGWGVFLGCVLGLASALAAPLDPDAIVFRYASNDGEISLECKHWPTGDPENHDWKVRCGIGTPLEKEYFVHLLFRPYPRALEVLYSVSDRSASAQTGARFTSNSLWLRYPESARPQSATVGQSVENDYASLTVEILRP